jgi:hypothetical protein
MARFVHGEIGAGGCAGLHSRATPYWTHACFRENGKQFFWRDLEAACPQAV